jgi:hypothetical protein
MNLDSPTGLIAGAISFFQEREFSSVSVFAREEEPLERHRVPFQGDFLVLA